MKQACFLLTALILLVILSSHDMYLKLDTYFLRPDSQASIQLFNGTFDKSDNTIDRSRMVDASLVGNGKRIPVDTNQWSEAGGVTILNFTTGEEGTWVAGVSTRPRNIEMTAADFNDYLEHDGVLDMLDWRKTNNALDQDAVERYSKHVKTIFQVGDQLSGDWISRLGYPLEFIPLSNPYDLHPGHALQVELLWQGKPLANQLVYVGSHKKEQQPGHSHADGAQHDPTEETPHSHAPDQSGEDHHHELDQYRTDANGTLSVNITHQGIWYLRTIHLAHSEEDGLTHESNWATLSFEIGEGHAHEHAEMVEHSHEHEHDTAVPSYVYWIGSLALFLGLFFWFNRQK